VRKRLVRTFLTVFIGHTLLCDVGSFVLGRFTTVDTWLALLLVVFAAILVTCLLEKPWKH
jgi:dolichyl-phosphate-mannose--protein O-mannosyl transferase